MVKFKSVFFCFVSSGLKPCYSVVQCSNCRADPIIDRTSVSQSLFVVFLQSKTNWAQWLRWHGKRYFWHSPFYKSDNFSSNSPTWVRTLLDNYFSSSNFIYFLLLHSGKRQGSETKREIIRFVWIGRIKTKKLETIFISNFINRYMCSTALVRNVWKWKREGVLCEERCSFSLQH